MCYIYTENGRTSFVRRTGRHISPVVCPLNPVSIFRVELIKAAGSPKTLLFHQYRPGHRMDLKCLIRCRPWCIVRSECSQCCCTLTTHPPSASLSSSSLCSGGISFDSYSLYPQNEIGPSISSSVVLCVFVLLVYIVVLV